ncbi:MAG TPA: chromosome segregation protein SMC [Terriglobales bacterium]|nr:chromosome segregation protein SMC [Terriglobales bacterium]
MLRLKKLQIHGFKSFGDRTELVFSGQGIVGVVGPNGCGKSNLADAICWVLGEQSARSLRGQRMEDVIFSGTRERPATGMAEVSLTLVNPEELDAADDDAELPLIEADDDWEEALPAPAPDGAPPEAAAVVDAGAAPPAEAVAAGQPGVVLTMRKRRKFTPHNRRGEIVVTRRLYRNGESEYLMNGRPCRLRDIQDLFMGTGLGPETYAIIEQGRIGQILSSKPHDRRAMIEEAAGVTKYKARKKLTEAKLEAARLNLARVNDIFEEVARQMGSLKRQAAKARRYRELKTELDAQQRRMLLAKAALLEREIAAADLNHRELAAALVERQRELDQAEAGRAHWFAEISRRESELREITEALGRWSMELDRAERGIEFNRRQIEDLTRRERALGDELAHLGGEQSAAAAAAERAAAEWQALSAEAGRAEADYETLRQTSERGAQRRACLEDRQRQTRALLLTSMGRLAQWSTEMARSRTLLASFDRQLERIEQERAQAREELTALGARQGQLQLAFSGRQDELASVTAALAATEAQVAELEHAREEARSRRDAAKDELARVAARRQSLEDIVAHHGYSTEAVRALFEGPAKAGAPASGFQPLGLLADFLEVEPEFEAVVEEFLREELNFVVVKNWDEATAGVGLLRRDAQGRATFLVHPEDGQYAMFSAGEAPPPLAPAVESAAPVPLRHCVRVLNGFGRSLEQILPKLGSGFILRDPGPARDLAARNPQAYFLTAGGECFHNQTVTAGTRGGAGPLTLKRELRDLARQEAAAAAAIEGFEAQFALRAREIALAAAERARLASLRHELEKELLTGGETLKQLAGEVRRVEERLQLFALEAERGRVERQQSAGRLAELESLAAAAESERAAAETEEAAIVAELTAAEREREVSAQALADAQAAVARCRERARAAEEARAASERSLADLARRLAQARQDLDRLAGQRGELEAQCAALAAQRAALTQARVEAEARRDALRAELTAAQGAGAAWEQAIAAARQTLEESRQRHGEADVARARLQSQAEYLNELCRNELHCELAELAAAPPPELEAAAAPLAAAEIAALESAVRELREKIDHLGPVNMMAIEEYGEIEQRHSFLGAQRQDLLDSIADAQRAIQEIDAVSRQRFNDAFASINGYFQKTFQELFGGGQGFLRLTDAENDPESGVDIVAQPPGKKLQNALLLSGGEKAMTAMALLLAIFQYQPSPFCLLDEVDAPLDEANVGRFTEMVKRMSTETQFILITHSPRTMESAAVLYGVTMPQAGVSRLVSVQLEQARRAAVS